MGLKILESRGLRRQQKQRLEKLSYCVLKRLSLFLSKKKIILPISAKASLALSVYIVPETKMQKINLALFNKNRPTTVISLPSFWEPIKNHLYLGEIYICREEAKKQSITEEALFIHGFIHLLGFDHKNETGIFDELEDELSKCLERKIKTNNNAII